MADSYRTVLLEISEPEIKIVMRQSQFVLSLFRRLIDVTFCWFTGMCVKVENLWNLRNHESIGNHVFGFKISIGDIFDGFMLAWSDTGSILLTSWLIKQQIRVLHFGAKVDFKNGLFAFHYSAAQFSPQWLFCVVGTVSGHYWNINSDIFMNFSDGNICLRVASQQYSVKVIKL